MPGRVREVGPCALRAVCITEGKQEVNKKPCHRVMITLSLQSDDSGCGMEPEGSGQTEDPCSLDCYGCNDHGEKWAYRGHLEKMGNVQADGWLTPLGIGKTGGMLTEVEH